MLGRSKSPEMGECILLGRGEVTVVILLLEPCRNDRLEIFGSVFFSIDKDFGDWMIWMIKMMKWWNVWLPESSRSKNIETCFHGHNFSREHCVTSKKCVSSANLHHETKTKIKKHSLIFSRQTPIFRSSYDLSFFKFSVEVTFVFFFQNFKNEKFTTSRFSIYDTWFHEGLNNDHSFYEHLIFFWSLSRQFFFVVLLHHSF